MIARRRSFRTAQPAPAFPRTWERGFCAAAPQ